MCYLLKTMGNTTHMIMTIPVVFLIPRTEQPKCSTYKGNVNSTSTSDSSFCSDVRADIEDYLVLLAIYCCIGNYQTLRGLKAPAFVLS